MKRFLCLFPALLIIFGSGFAYADFYKVEGGCESKYSPKGGVQEAIVALIGSAKKSVKVLAYSFTSQPIAQALVDAKKRGVVVEVVLDKSQPTANGNQIGLLTEADIPVWIDRKHAIAHNKVMIVDGKIYENGSFNYTYSAENSNGENATICKSVGGAASFTRNFELHKSHSEGGLQ